MFSPDKNRPAVAHPAAVGRMNDELNLRNIRVRQRQNAARRVFLALRIHQQPDHFAGADLAHHLAINPADGVHFARPIGLMMRPGQPGGGVRFPFRRHGIAEPTAVHGVKSFGVDKTAAGALNSALTEIGTLPVEAISANADKKSSFGTDDQGVKVEIKQGSDTFDFVVGKAAADYSGTYIAQPDFGKTYLIALDLNSLFGRNDWRNLTIFSFLKERSTKIRFQYPNLQFVAEKINNKWTGTQPKKFNVSDDKITAVLGLLENLTAAKIPAQSFANTGLEKHGIIIQVTGEGFDNTLMIGDCTKDNLCYAKRGDSDNIYLINKTDRDALNKKMTDLK